MEVALDNHQRSLARLDIDILENSVLEERYSPRVKTWMSLVCGGNRTSKMALTFVHCMTTHMDQVWRRGIRVTHQRSQSHLPQRIEIANVEPMPIPEEYVHIHCLRWKSE